MLFGNDSSLVACHQLIKPGQLRLFVEVIESKYFTPKTVCINFLLQIVGLQRPKIPLQRILIDLRSRKVDSDANLKGGTTKDIV